MNVWANTVLTDAGRTLLAKLTEGHTLNITGAYTGAGFVTPGLLSKQTEVTDERQSMGFRPVAYPEAGKCAITVALDNEGLEYGYTANQVGIFADDPDEGEILLFITQATDANSGTIIPSETEMPGYSAEWTFYFQYGQADSVEVVVDPSGTVTKAQLDQGLAGKADKNHASPAATYGMGTGTNYGHVQLSSAVNSTKGTNDGVAATPAAVKAAYDLANRVPAFTGSDNGKFLRIVNGAATWATVNNAEGVSF